jgi:hypothetical protein
VSRIIFAFTTGSHSRRAGLDSKRGCACGLWTPSLQGLTPLAIDCRPSGAFFRPEGALHIAQGASPGEKIHRHTRKRRVLLIVTGATVDYEGSHPLTPRAAGDAPLGRERNARLVEPGTGVAVTPTGRPSPPARSRPRPLNGATPISPGVKGTPRRLAVLGVPFRLFSFARIARAVYSPPHRQNRNRNLLNRRTSDVDVHWRSAVRRRQRGGTY